MSSLNSLGDHATIARYETFSYLPPLTREEILQQILYIIDNGWNLSLEHEHPSKGFEYYWPMWKLPFFGEQDPNVIMAEIEACRRAYPDHHVRVVGYDTYAQTKGHSFIVHRAR
ncbi:ribulose bisphosphate carboxylase small subunit [Caldichromatium japonicum]|uniref:Ribulose bisphosphate carboxylase small subunit n=1 Tax=Caldichromatium japonicum TaxID=2699430 RepID=A0A6G7VGH1_9GAMM|nr:ribulose bisphosphate carboxylase small subunit [Caldichromatium japonicum]QIK38976.1 ribulose bisphosphate carboxylase small subunit [Caldichromatium japonicum]